MREEEKTSQGTYRRNGTFYNSIYVLSVTKNFVRSFKKIIWLSILKDAFNDYQLLNYSSCLYCQKQSMVPVFQEQKDRLERDITGADFSSFDLGKADIQSMYNIFFPDFQSFLSLFVIIER